jgi:hypothetical protein
MSDAYDSVAEWLEHPVTQRMVQKVNETRHQKLIEVRYTPADYKGEERSVDAIAMFNAYSQGLLDGLDELMSIKQEIIKESRGEDLDGN